MSSWPNSDPSGAAVTPRAPEVQTGQMLLSSSSAYFILEFVGEGGFGKVARCQNLTTKEAVAVKILKDLDFIKDTEREVSILEVINILNPDHINVVKFFERFEYMGQTCLAFEMLDRSLYDLLHEQHWNPLSLNEIRPIAKQLLVALDALKNLGILHTDIKPDNIMLVDKEDQPLKVKLIDFGEAIPASKVEPGMLLQAIGYRAPEVSLGLPFNEAIDTWGVGCILAFLYLADNLFPVDCDYQMMKCMVDVLGQPEDHLLSSGIYTRHFFSEKETADGLTWRMMTPEEYAAANNVNPEDRHSFIDLPSSLDDLVNVYPDRKETEYEDRRAFVDLMKQLLHLHGDQRSSPHRALQHSFITMSHLTKHPDSSAYLSTSQAMMHICTVEDSASPASSGSSDIPPAKCYKDSAAWSSDEALLSVSYDNSPATWSSVEALSLVSYDEDPATWSSGERLPSFFYEEDSVSFTSDERLINFCYNRPAAWSSDEELPCVYIDKDLTAWSSGEQLPSFSYDEDSIAFTSDERLISFYYNSPAAWSSDEELPSFYDDEHSATWSVSERLYSVSCENLAAWSSHEVLPSVIHDEDPAASSSDGDKQTASASSGRPNTFLKRIRRLFSHITASFCCCCSPTIED